MRQNSAGTEAKLRREADRLAVIFKTGGWPSFQEGLLLWKGFLQDRIRLEVKTIWLRFEVSWYYYAMYFRNLCS